MKKIIFVLLTFAICISYKISFSQNDTSIFKGTKLLISTDKKDYLEGEAVWEIVMLIIDKDVKLDCCPCFGHFNDLQASYKNSLRNLMPFQGGRGDCNFGTPKEYPDTISFMDQSEFGYQEIAPNTSFTNSYYFPADEYEFNAYVIVSINGKKYKINAKPWNFTVYKPEGDEILVRQSYLNIFQLFYKGNSYEKAISDSLENILIKYPNSSYIDRVLNFEYLILKYKEMSPVEQKDYELNQINLNPYRASNLHRLYSILSYFEYKKDSKGFLNLLYNLESKYKGDHVFDSIIFTIKKCFKEDYFIYKKFE